MNSLPRIHDRIRLILTSLREYLGTRGRGRQKAVSDVGELRFFLDSRASHVSQIALYGYLKTRAGTRFPELFESDSFLVAINQAKWQVWLACLSDIAVYAGGLIAARSSAEKAEIRGLMEAVVESILQVHGIPEDSGPDFEAGAQRARARLALVDWTAVEDGPGPFTESPEALVTWAPVVDEFKELDGEIVRNSVRYRWVEVRRALRDILNADAVMASARSAESGFARRADGKEQP